MGNSDKRRKALEQQLKTAGSYSEWYAAAEALDELDGLLDWRRQNGTRLLHESLILQHIGDLRACRSQGDTTALTRVLQESLYRHLGELSNPELYAVARTGTKHLVSDFLEEVELSMNFLCDHPMAGASEAQKLKLFEEAEKVYGRPALMLSGGAAFGIYHLGVTRALWQQGLLPDVIAGASMGAIVAGGICNRNEAELEAFFREPENLHLEAFRWLSPQRMWRHGYAMDQSQLQEHIRSNVGSRSFREAYRHSGRVLNISVSPTRTRQKPRLLNELASPDVLVDSAVLASCAVPGIYPPVTLQARRPDQGRSPVKPYMPTERWIDGSVHGDLPLMRMARLHNVNKTIVSQANPHVLPFITDQQQSGAKARLKQAASSVAHAQVASALKLTRNSWPSPVLRPLLEQAHAMTSQTYLGDITLQFPFRPTLYRKLLANPSPAELNMYLHIGEQTTWPKLAMIHDQTRISRAFAECIRRLRQRINENAQP